MAVETKFTITAECDSDGCFKEVRHVIDGDWFNDNIDETEMQDFIIQLEMDGWEVVRVRYEEIEVYCPECQRKRLAV